MSEMVGPAGSISEGAFSRAYICPEDELWLEEELLEDWAGVNMGANPTNKNRIATGKKAEDCNRRVMRKPCLQVYLDAPAGSNHQRGSTLRDKFGYTHLQSTMPVYDLINIIGTSIY
jgi:hypothetical protein